MADSPESTEYGLVMPFVVCQSNGGPYEDQSFVAGFQAGQLDRALQAAAAIGADQVRATIYAALVPQVELIGMRHGFPVLTTDTRLDTSDWTHVTFATKDDAKEAQP